MPLPPKTYRDRFGGVKRDYTARNGVLRQVLHEAWSAASQAIQKHPVPPIQGRGVAYVDVSPCSFTRMCAKHTLEHAGVWPGMFGEEITSPNGHPVFGRRFVLTRADAPVSVDAAYAGAVAFAQHIEPELAGVVPRIIITWEKLS